MNKQGNFNSDQAGGKKQPDIPKKYVEALNIIRIIDAHNSLEDGYNADHAEDLAREMYEEMRIYFHDFNLTKEIHTVDGKKIPVIDAESFEIARYGPNDYRYKDNLGQTLQEASILRIVERMGDNLELNSIQEEVKNQLSRENIEQQMIDDVKVMTKVALFFNPDQIELLPPTDMYRHTQQIKDNEDLNYNYDLEDDDTQDGEVVYVDANGKEYKMTGPLLDYNPKTDNTPSVELSLKTIMVPGVGIIMYNVSKKYFELTTFEHKTVRANSIEGLKEELDKLK